MHTNLPKQDLKLVSRRQSGDISRDLRQTSTPTTLRIHGRRSKTSPPPEDRPPSVSIADVNNPAEDEYE